MAPKLWILTTCYCCCRCWLAIWSAQCEHHRGTRQPRRRCWHSDHAQYFSLAGGAAHVPLAVSAPYPDSRKTGGSGWSHRECGQNNGRGKVRLEGRKVRLTQAASYKWLWRRRHAVVHACFVVWVCMHAFISIGRIEECPESWKKAYANAFLGDWRERHKAFLICF